MRAPVRRFRFGVQQEVAATGAQWLDGARQAEALGFDSLLMPDHFGLQFGPLAGLSAAAAVTSRLRVGTLVAANDFRHPLALAKEAATIDVISAGRFELGLGAGWDGSDYTETGIPFAGAGERIDRLAEAITVLKAAFSGQSFSFEGKHYQVSGYAGGPLPVQRPHPPLMIGAAGPRLLGLAAREADIVTLCPRTRQDGSGLILSSVSADATERKIGWVREAAGGRAAQVELGALVFAVEITTHRQHAAEALAARWDLTPQDVLDSPHLLAGTPGQIAEDLLGYRERYGISYWVVQDMQPFDQVLPRLAGS